MTMRMDRLGRILSHIERATRTEKSGGIAILTVVLTADERKYLYGQVQALMRTRGTKRYSYSWDALESGHRVAIRFPARSRTSPGQLSLPLYDLRPQPRPRSRLHRAPGSRLDALARFLAKKRTYETVLRPYLAEMQEEYFEALKEGRLRKSKWVRIRGIAGFWSTVALQLLVSATRVVKKLWTISGG